MPHSFPTRRSSDLKLVRRRCYVRCAIVHGDGPSFCAGLDIKSVMSNKAQAFALYLKLWWPFANAFQCFSIGWRKLPFPVIAAVHGNCFGAGMQLALGEIGRASCRERVCQYV